MQIQNNISIVKTQTVISFFSFYINENHRLVVICDEVKGDQLPPDVLTEIIFGICDTTDMQ